MTDPVLTFLDAEKPKVLERLLELVRIPSVSADPSYESGMENTRRLLIDRLRLIGMSNVQTLDVDGHPAVYCEWLAKPRRPTILVYGHYDVQPPDPLELWTSPPFEPEIRANRIYGRGVSDDKAPTSIALEALGAFLRVENALPVNVKVLLEGEEEVGSATLEKIMCNNRELLSADAVLSADGARWLPGLNTVNVGGRGNAGFEFTIRSADKDLHSGRYGGVVPNALHVLARLVAELHAPDGSVTVPGFYDCVRKQNEAELQEIAGIPFDEQAFISATGARHFGEPHYSTIERLWLRPCLDVNGMWGGYTKPGSKTVIPGEAHAKVTIRVVPDQKPGPVSQLVKDFLVSRCPKSCVIEFGADRGQSAAYDLPKNHPLLHAVETALADTYGCTPHRIRMGGTLPMADIVSRVLGIDTVMFSFSIADEDFHAPNEFFRLSSIDEGLSAWVKLFRCLGNTFPRDFDAFRIR